MLSVRLAGSALVPAGRRCGRHADGRPAPADPGEKLSSGVELGADHFDHPQAFIGRVVKDGQRQLRQQIWGSCQSSGTWSSGRGCQAAAALVAGC
jgi:hypothetical protein